MKEISVPTYEADDGTRFTTKAECLRHELKTELPDMFDYRGKDLIEYLDELSVECPTTFQKLREYLT